MAIGFPAISAGTLSLSSNINGNFEVSSTVGWLYGAAVSPDGTKLFAMDRRVPGGAGAGTQKTGKVHQFTAPAGWYTTFNVEPTYDNVTLNFSGLTSYTRGLRFNTSGNRLYILGENDNIFQYNLQTPWNLSTASYSNNSITLTTVASDVNSILFNNNGTKMYVLDGGSKTIYQYTMSTPDDISTATYDGSSSDYVITSASYPVDFSFNSDGTKLYIQLATYLHRYSLSTAYDTSTATPDNTSASFSSFYLGNGHPSGVTSIGGTPTGFIFNHDRSHIFHLHGTYNSTYGEYVSGFVPYAVTEVDGVGDGSTFTFNNRDYIYDGTKEAWEVNSPITVAQTGSPVSDLSELADSTSILSDPANEVLTYADLNAILAVTNPATGQLAFNLDTSDMYIFGGTNWQKVYDEDDVPPPPPPYSWGGDRAFYAGGLDDPLRYDNIQYWEIATPGNASVFGNLETGVNSAAAMSDSNRIVIAEGSTNGGTSTDGIQYFGSASLGNASLFGTISTLAYLHSGCSDGTYGVWGGGTSTAIQYVTIQTTGNSSSFGTLPYASYGRMTWSDATYGLFAGGSDTGGTNRTTIDYITVASPSNSTTFGDITQARRMGAGAGDTTRSLFGCGLASSNSNVIDYVTTATTGSATDFGDSTTTRERPAASSDGTYANWAGGGTWPTGPVGTGLIDVVTIQTPSNATDFGDLTTTNLSAAGSSGSSS